jgi:hypothetical protein
MITSSIDGLEEISNGPKENWHHFIFKASSLLGTVFVNRESLENVNWEFIHFYLQQKDKVSQNFQFNMLFELMSYNQTKNIYESGVIKNYTQDIYTFIDISLAFVTRKYLDSGDHTIIQKIFDKSYHNISEYGVFELLKVAILKDETYSNIHDKLLYYVLDKVVEKIDYIHFGDIIPYIKESKTQEIFIEKIEKVIKGYKLTKSRFWDKVFTHFDFNILVKFQNHPNIETYVDDDFYEFISRNDGLTDEFIQQHWKKMDVEKLFIIGKVHGGNWKKFEELIKDHFELFIKHQKGKIAEDFIDNFKIQFKKNIEDGDEALAIQDFVNRTYLSPKLLFKIFDNITIDKNESFTIGENSPKKLIVQIIVNYIKSTFLLDEDYDFLDKMVKEKLFGSFTHRLNDSKDQRSSQPDYLFIKTIEKSGFGIDDFNRIAKSELITKKILMDEFIYTDHKIADKELKDKLLLLKRLIQ